MKRISTIAATAALLIVPTLTGCAPTAAKGDATSEVEFPPSNATIEWVVPSAAGGGNDILARIIAPAMQEELGANVKVVNKEGAGQVLGLNYVATAEPDGLTFGATNIPSILGRYLDPSKKSGFDRSSFTPIGSFGSNALVIAVNKNSPHKTLGELFDAVKAQPGTVIAGTDSRGGDDHVNLAILENKLDLDFNIVHYNSGADKVAALLSGEVEFALGGVSSFYGHYQSGDIRVLTVVDDEPSPFTPDVPTIESAGYDVEPMSSNFGLSVPSDTPPAIVSSLEAALKSAVEDPAVQEKIEASGTQPAWLSAEEFDTLWAEREAEIQPVIGDILAEK